MANPLDNYRNPWDQRSVSSITNSTDIDSTDVLNNPLFDYDKVVLGTDPASRITVELYENDTIIPLNGIAYITAEPQMPLLKLKVKSDYYTNKLSYKLIIKYSHTYNNIQREIERVFPEVGKVGIININVLQTISYDRNNQLVGGEATIRIFESEHGENLLYEFAFKIKGINPTFAAVENYLSEKNYNWWFLKGIIRQESGGGHQFDLRKSNKDMPLFGYPDGFGIIQVDYYDEYMSGERNTNLDHIWNWKINIDKGIEKIKIKKADALRHFKKKTNDFKKSWDEDHDLIVYEDDKVEGAITFVHAPATIEGFEEVSQYFEVGKVTNNTTKSFIDAEVIKRYNSGSFYNVKYNSKDKKWYWKIDDTAGNGKNYVEMICNKLTVILIFVFLSIHVYSQQKTETQYSDTITQIVDSIGAVDRIAKKKQEFFKKAKPAIFSLPKSITTQLPQGCNILSVAQGNLNNDNLMDCAVIVGFGEDSLSGLFKPIVLTDSIENEKIANYESERWIYVFLRKKKSFKITGFNKFIVLGKRAMHNGQNEIFNLDSSENVPTVDLQIDQKKKLILEQLVLGGQGMFETIFLCQREKIFITSFKSLFRTKNGSNSIRQQLFKDLNKLTRGDVKYFPTKEN
jgi:hypothetical protein